MGYGDAQWVVAFGYYRTCQADRILVEAEKAVALNPYDPFVLGTVGRATRQRERRRPEVP
jgi:hypothetical protein